VFVTIDFNIQDQLNFIKQIHKNKGHKEHNIRLLNKDGLYELEYNTNYWARIVHESQKHIEE
jgi:hypothetical protein